MEGQEGTLSQGHSSPSPQHIVKEGHSECPQIREVPLFLGRRVAYAAAPIFKSSALELWVQEECYSAAHGRGHSWAWSHLILKLDNGDRLVYPYFKDEETEIQRAGWQRSHGLEGAE